MKRMRRKINKRKRAAICKKLLSGAAVAAAAFVTVGFMPVEKEGLSPVEPPEQQEEAPKERSYIAGLYDPITPQWEAILMDYAEAKRGDMAQREQFCRGATARIEALSKFDLGSYFGRENIYRLYAAVSLAEDKLEAAGEFEEALTCVCSVFDRLEHIKEGGVFTRQSMQELSQAVLEGCTVAESYLLTADSKPIRETLVARNSRELVQEAAEAAQFLSERMDALEGKVTEEEYVVYRYALGGGWEEHKKPEWLHTEVLDKLCLIVREEAIHPVFRDDIWI